MSDLPTAITTVLAAHGYRIEHDEAGRTFATIVCVCGNRYGFGATHLAHVASELAPVVEQVRADAKREALVEAAGALNPELVHYRRDAMEVLTQQTKPAGGDETLSLQFALVAAGHTRDWLRGRAAGL